MVDGYVTVNCRKKHVDFFNINIENARQLTYILTISNSTCRDITDE